ncbi:hypothetical protein PR202_ga06397 [Eleusine coracana subsp. coracana]|uniref:Uncharacterized protein n=1 Tax=Eleusine coracana subsp. coracana TaxID=191504 RepID=A0AAV5BYC7_ELECO|nr:hypothetical protein PR202_ga06397 [Eleusine coracana subsp. coracana]
MSSQSLSPPLWSSERPMLSRSLSPPLWSSRGCDDEHRTESSMTALSLRPRRPLKLDRRVTSMPALLPLTAHVWRDWSPPPSPPQPSYGSFEHRGLHTPSHPQNQEESGSGSELDSAPHLIIIEPEGEEPHSPTSPPCSPLSVSPKESIFGSDTEEWHPSDVEEDQYFKSMVDNFVSASADVFQSALSEDEIDKAAHHLRQSDKYADIALKHYNDDENNKVKYELIKAISSLCNNGEEELLRSCEFYSKREST